MTVIKQEDLIESVAAALQYISYYHPADYIAHLARAYEAEQSPAAKDAIAQILTNSRMCAEGKRPICQDTGIVNVFLRIGMEVRFEGFKGSVTDAVNEGVRRGYNNPDNVLRAYGSSKFTFGREYLIPKPFDSRVLLNVPVAVARAAAKTGVAQEPITDYDAYRRRLEQLLGRARGMMHGVYDRAKRDPKRIVFPEGDQEKIIRAAKIMLLNRRRLRWKFAAATCRASRRLHMPIAKTSRA